MDEPEHLPSPSPVKSKNVRWDFNSDCWVATVETGSSVKERRLKPSKITLQEASMFLDQNVSLNSMGYEEQKRIAHEILTAWLQPQDSVQNNDRRSLSIKAVLLTIGMESTRPWLWVAWSIIY